MFKDSNFLIVSFTLSDISIVVWSLWVKPGAITCWQLWAYIGNQCYNSSRKHYKLVIVFKPGEPAYFMATYWNRYFWFKFIHVPIKYLLCSKIVLFWVSWNLSDISMLVWSMWVNPVASTRRQPWAQISNQCYNSVCKLYQLVFGFKPYEPAYFMVSYCNRIFLLKAQPCPN
jgi:hypothetical protein